MHCCVGLQILCTFLWQLWDSVSDGKLQVRPRHFFLGLVWLYKQASISTSMTRYLCCWVWSDTHVTHFHRFNRIALICGGVINGKNLQQNRFFYSHERSHTRTHTHKRNSRVVCVKNKWEKRRQKLSKNKG